MTTATDCILLAAAAAKASKLPPFTAPRVEPLEVERAIANHLEHGARAGRRDREAPAFSLGTFNPADAKERALWDAVYTKLDQLGLDVIARPTRIGVRELPCELFVTYESLDRAAERVEQDRASWLEAARGVWQRAVGEAGAVLVQPGAFGPVAVFLGPERSPEDAAWFADAWHRAQGRPRWESGTGFYEQDPYELAARAVRELKLPAWTFDGVSKLWAEQTGGEAKRSKGLWSTDGMRPGATIVFSLEGREETVLVEDVADMRPDALVEEVFRKLGTAAPGTADGGGDTSEGAAHGAAATNDKEPAQATQATPSHPGQQKPKKQGPGGTGR